jgi:hypothetical protein
MLIGKTEQLSSAFDILEYEDELELANLRHQAEVDQLRADYWDLKEKLKHLEEIIEGQEKLIFGIVKNIAETTGIHYAKDKGL